LAKQTYPREGVVTRFWALLVAKAIILAHAGWVAHPEGKGGNWPQGWRHIVVRVRCLVFPRTAWDFRECV